LIDADSLLSNGEKRNNFKKTARKYLMGGHQTPTEFIDPEMYSTERICILFKHALDVDLYPLEIKDNMNAVSEINSKIVCEVHVSKVFNSDKLVTVNKE